MCVCVCVCVYLCVRHRAEAERKMREHKMLAEKGAWKPTQSNKTDMVRSIVRMNLR